LLEQLGAVIYVQQFVPHDGWDMRILLVGDRTFAIRRTNDADWRTNVSRGATAEAIVPDDEALHLALQAAETLGASIAGVDVLRRTDGTKFLLEVNSSPGWKAVAKATHSDVARTVLEHVGDLVNRRRSKGEDLA
jgi:glutathione synthase/RimK-type ligase-like ATP-grasp enzyme